MAADVAVQVSAELVERVVVGGDLSKLSAHERMAYYGAVCESVRLNPLTRPFDYLTLNGKLVLYAKKDATDQLRTLHGVSIVPPLESKVVEGVYVVTAYAKNEKGRTDTATGAVAIAGLRGEALANAMMKAETKSKRRVTLSICGLGLLDETEIESIPGAVRGEPIEYDLSQLPPDPPHAAEVTRATQRIDATKPACPHCSVLLYKHKDKPGYFCWKARGGCGKNVTDEELRAKPVDEETGEVMDEVPF